MKAFPLRRFDTAFWRQFASLWLPCCLVIFLVMLAIYRQQVARRLTQLAQAQQNQVALQSESIQQGFNAIVSDLSLLSQSSALRQALDASDSAGWRTLSYEFQLFAQTKQVYDQVRLLDASGHEIVRVNLRDGQAEIVGADQLQSKADRDYFARTAQLEAGAIFVSALDLNVENGEVESPWKPTVRLATPVFGSDGTRRGVVVLNYLCSSLLSRFRRLSDPELGEPMWLNQQGYWVSGGDSKRAWGFMFPDRSEDRFDRLDPAAWQHMVRNQDGHFSTDRGLVAFQTVVPASDADAHWRLPASRLVFPDEQPYVWKIAAWLKADLWQSSLSELRWLVLAIGTTGCMLAAAVCASVSWYSQSRRAWSRSLQLSEARFRQMADAIVDVFWLSGNDRRKFVYVSPAFSRIWGRSASLEDTANVWMNAVLPEDQPQLARIRQAMVSEEQFSERYRIVRPDGQVRWIWDQGFPVRENGRVSRYAGIAEDVTDVQAAQDKLLQSERLVAVGEAITSLAHDSRNALQRSQVCLEMLIKRIQDQPAALDLAQRSQIALRELHQLYDRLKRFAAPVVLDPDVVPLTEIWDQAISDLRESLDARQVELTTESEGLHDSRCQVDSLAMRQVFRNLIENAIDSMHESGAAPARLQVVWREAELEGRGAVQVLIRDSGSGIEESMLERVFEPFQTSKPYGTGLGLAIARRLVEAHQGQISARNRADRPGLEIDVLLPRSLK